MRSAAAVACVLAAVPPPALAQRAASLVNEGRVAHAKKDYALAAKRYAEALARGADDPLDHQRWVSRLAHYLTGSDADDIAQDTWVTALRSPPDSGRPLRPWLG
jgi:tetratricopeptide (TPR) repeat protein